MSSPDELSGTFTIDCSPLMPTEAEVAELVKRLCRVPLVVNCRTGEILVGDAAVEAMKRENARSSEEPG